jgi:hypothetical protein
MYQRSGIKDTISIRPTRPSHAYERASRKPRSSRSEAISKLKPAYSHAARAFLHHRIEEAHTLVEEAFELLQPPASQENDQLSTYRRKWDILRITLETTLYTTPVSGSAPKHNGKLGHIAQPSTSSNVSTPDAPHSPNGSTSPRSKSPLDDPLLLSPPSLLATLHTRSLKLFTPPLERPNSRFLPASVLVALVLASLKLDCPQVGRGMIDDWLANRDPLGLGSDDPVVAKKEEKEGYEKVVEVYCLHVLPRLSEWDYSKEFLDSEIEMRPAKREVSHSIGRFLNIPESCYYRNSLPLWLRTMLNRYSLQAHAPVDWTVWITRSLEVQGHLPLERFPQRRPAFHPTPQSQIHVRLSHFHIASLLSRSLHHYLHPQLRRSVKDILSIFHPILSQQL